MSGTHADVSQELMQMMSGTELMQMMSGTHADVNVRNSCR
jgi:hypothetical protein